MGFTDGEHSVRCKRSAAMKITPSGVMKAILRISEEPAELTLPDFPLRAITGEHLLMSALTGRVVLIVNVASQCGMTPQYAALESLWRIYRERGLTIIGCPCDQFGGQEPGSADDIIAFCTQSYEVSFPISEKVKVNGDDAHPLWSWLKSEKSGVLGTTAIKWNFTKFLIGRDGRVIERFSPTDAPAQMIPAIEAALEAIPAAVA